MYCLIEHTSSSECPISGLMVLSCSFFVVEFWTINSRNVQFTPQKRHFVKNGMPFMKKKRISICKSNTSTRIYLIMWLIPDIISDFILVFMEWYILTNRFYKVIKNYKNTWKRVLGYHFQTIRTSVFILKDTFRSFQCIIFMSDSWMIHNQNSLIKEY